MSFPKLTVYADGSCRPFKNPQDSTIFYIAGSGVWFGENDDRNMSCQVPGEQTNNRGELYAIYLVLDWISKTPSISNNQIEIVTDSLYSINVITKKWKPSLNFDLLEMIWKLYIPLKTHIEFKWVRGHTGIRGNEGADELANQACLDLYNILVE